MHEFVDIASGLNDSRKRLLRLLRGAMSEQFATVIVTSPDRLSRFGRRLLQEVMKYRGVTVKVLDNLPPSDPRQELVADIAALMHSFSGKLYRMRRGMARLQSPVPP